MRSKQVFIKLIFTIYIICFFSGGLRHWIDILNGGIFPYKNIPFVFNFYLTSLAIFDFIVIVLLVARPIWGLLLALFIMVTDLMTDFYIGYYYWGINLESNHALQLLVIFGLFVFISAPLLVKQIQTVRTL